MSGCKIQIPQILGGKIQILKFQDKIQSPPNFRSVICDIPLNLYIILLILINSKKDNIVLHLIKKPNIYLIHIYIHIYIAKFKYSILGAVP